MKLKKYNFVQNLRAFNRYKNSLDNDINIFHLFEVEIAEWKICGKISTIAKISEKVTVPETNNQPTYLDQPRSTANSTLILGLNSCGSSRILFLKMHIFHIPYFFYKNVCYNNRH